MTDFDHAEISRRLALAIGWPEHRICHESWGAVYIGHGPGLPIGKFLDYRDPAVIWPIAERFNCFPSMSSCGIEWCSYTAGASTTWADTAALAVAMAAIKAKEKS